ncbi:MAG: molybdopterin converting factor subunit 1 [Labilithrix sp.]|nr:molybdopterin converting factor subunit 1 [Labilithrix sp.]
MTITLLYFAAVRELVGRDEERVTLPPDVGSIAELAVFLERRHAALAGRLAAVRFARNETFATRDETLADGDVVALIPPVAGG